MSWKYVSGCVEAVGALRPPTFNVDRPSHAPRNANNAATAIARPPVRIMSPRCRHGAQRRADRVVGAGDELRGLSCLRKAVVPAVVGSDGEPTGASTQRFRAG